MTATFNPNQTKMLGYLVYRLLRVKEPNTVYSLGQLSASLAVMLLLHAEQSVVAETVNDVNR